MTFKEEYSDELGNYYTLPVLYKYTKLNLELRWEVIVINENSIVTKSYFVPDGKMKQSAPTIVTGKKKGRSNETSELEQALFNAYSMWIKHKEHFYYSEVGGEEHTKPHPMLANPYKEFGQRHLKEPFGVSPKLDGVRAICIMKNSIELLSKNGFPVVFLDTVKQHLTHLNSLLEDETYTLDGEIYTHDISFNLITGAMRAMTKKSPHDAKMEYWIFDLIDSALTYRERCEQLAFLQDVYELNQEPPYVLKFVYFEEGTHDKVEDFHTEFVKQGYEGLMARNLDSKYEMFRSNHLLKYKHFTDKEYVIVNTSAGVGNEQDAIMFVCKVGGKEHPDNTFSVRLRGSVQARKEMYKHKQDYIGKLLTVRFQETDKTTGIPRFPVGIDIRDYE